MEEKLEMGQWEDLGWWLHVRKFEQLLVRLGEARPIEFDSINTA